MSHTRFQPKLLALLMAVAGLLSACGGGGGSATVTTAALSSGTISGLGSIIVNGVRYETVGSDVFDADDGTTVISSPLRIGMTVSVEQSGTDELTQRAIAGKILIQGGIKGVASYSNAILTVASMPITTDASTIFLDTSGVATSLDALNAKSVEVYGLPQADGSFLATLVEEESGSLNVQLVGTVRSVDTTAKTLVLGTAITGITVNYANITAPSALAAGVVIAVKTATSTTATTYTATSLRIRSASADTYESYASNYSGTTGASNERNELYGAVSNKVLTYNGSTVTGCTFTIQGIQVQASSATLCNKITEGSYVEAKGTISNGVLIASKIEFESSESSTGYSDDWNDSDSDGLSHRSLTTTTTTTTTTSTNTNTSTSTGTTTTATQSSRSFEMYGLLNCAALNVGCTLTSANVTYTADLSSAYWDDNQSITNGYVEAKGYLTGTTFKVSKIESKSDDHDGDDNDD